MIFEEKKIASERIYEGAILNVRRDEVTAVKGHAYREIIEHNGAVAMIAIKDDGNVIMVSQYRYACGRAVLEIPAGKIDKGETVCTGGGSRTQGRDRLHSREHKVSWQDKSECGVFGRSDIYLRDDGSHAG